MAPATETFLSETLDALAKLNTVLKAIAGSEEMKIAEAAVPGLAQIVADISLGEDANTLLIAVIPLVETVAALLKSQGVILTIGPATTEQIDAIDAQKDAM
jgi:hypothetical protein